VRHTFASEALAAGISIFELSRLTGASVREIARTYGHLVRDSEDAIRARLDARAGRSGVLLASGSGSRTWLKCVVGVHEAAPRTRPYAMITASGVVTVPPA
jgi:hypothetical protein